MFQQLNQYLFQFRALSLPQFGTIKLVAQPARLDVTEHLIYAPGYQPQYSADDTPSDHQLEYFAAALQKDVQAVHDFFTTAGKVLKQKATGGAFDWSGIGTFEWSNQQILFNPQAASTLQPVPAHRVLREKTQHAVLVGDQVVMTDPAAEKVVEAKRSRDWAIVIAWVLGVLALLAIVFYLYQNHFSPQAAGTQVKVQPAAPAPTWQ